MIDSIQLFGFIGLYNKEIFNDDIIDNIINNDNINKVLVWIPDENKMVTTVIKIFNVFEKILNSKLNIELHLHILEFDNKNEFYLTYNIYRYKYYKGCILEKYDEFSIFDIAYLKQQKNEY